MLLSAAIQLFIRAIRVEKEWSAALQALWGDIQRLFF